MRPPNSIMWPQQKDKDSAVSNNSFETSVAALLRAEAAQTGISSSNGGTGAGGRFTTVEELTEVLCSGGTLCGRELYRFLDQYSVDSEPERAPLSSRIHESSFTFASLDLASALAASEKLSRPLAAVILCLDEHDGHLQQSSALWRELSSPGRLLELLQRRMSVWVIGIRTAYLCGRLHELIAVHSLPVILIFAHKEQRASLLETLACPGGTTEFIIQRIEEICDLYGPLLQIETPGGVFGGLHASDECSEADSEDGASQVDMNFSQNRRE
ncbi:hypothetical protein F1559_001690 [Cyanidiococcus yangmingshanensis]|uniref:Uncharacterized protein n=1 Tax=Cyanidiococcus yangmingshanensis TaxID=2690220 RepID=A0A7J7IKG4_9RHOD|nr:hypothetical protein F1559_001690 [Cyanidiococcus yangmingshanensis]